MEKRVKFISVQSAVPGDVVVFNDNKRQLAFGIVLAVCDTGPNPESLFIDVSVLWADTRAEGWMSAKSRVVGLV